MGSFNKNIFCMSAVAFTLEYDFKNDNSKQKLMDLTGSWTAWAETQSFWKDGTLLNMRADLTKNGYREVQVFANAEKFEAFCAAQMSFPKLEDMMAMTSELSAVDEACYCAEGDYEKMPSAAEWYPNAKKNIGAVDVAKFGEVRFGFPK